MIFVKGKNAIGGFKAPSEIRFPPTGLEPGLSYEVFAGRVEVVEYIMWVVDVEEDDELDEESTFPSDTSKYNSSPISELPPSVGVPSARLAKDAMDDINPGSPSCRSSSTLSPPPEIIMTPPFMNCFTPARATGNFGDDNLHYQERSPTPVSRRTRQGKARDKNLQ